jgi:ISCaje4 transposase tnpB|nr:MAG TPA: crossover junction endodeoxyribonuclease [Bacteriophage sp.]
MKTIVLDITSDIDMLLGTQKVFNNMVRYSYNRFDNNGSLKEKELRVVVTKTFNQPSWLTQCAIKDATYLYKSNKAKGSSKPVIFGGIKNYIDLLLKKKTKEQYKLDKLLPITFQGEACKCGNRMFNFNFDNNELIYKPNKKQHYTLTYKHPRKNILRDLLQLQELSKQNKIAITIKLNVPTKKLYITFDESKLQYEKYTELKANRIIGIDLNPNAIGISILDFNEKNSEDFKVLHKEVISTYELNRKNISSNKRKFELIEICYHIDKLLKTWKCKRICLEELKVSSSDKQKGKEFNRLCNNVWCRDLVINKLKMLSNIHGYFITEINPAYSSFIGNILYGAEDTPDMVASSIEIARRAYNKYKTGHFYPPIQFDHLNEQWKQTLNGLNSWKEMFDKVKESGLKYRFLLLDCIKNAVFSKIYIKHVVTLYAF